MIFRFESFVLDSDRRELHDGARLRRVEPQVFDLIEYLIRNRDRVVSTAELFGAIWHGRIVSDSALSTRINAARAALKDSGAEQRLIRTLRTKGVRFVGVVWEEKMASAHKAPAIPAASKRAPMTADRPHIAVLPFAGIGGDRGQEQFGDGVTEELIIALSKTGWLSVASRNSSFAYKGKALPTKQLAHKLGARFVLEGSVREAAGRLRVSAQLIDAMTGQPLWAERYEQDGKDTFLAQDAVTEKILAAVESQVYLAEDHRARLVSTESLGAWDCMIRSLALMNSRKKAHIAEARRLLQRAIKLDPNSAQAHSLLSIATTLGVHMSWTDRKTAVAPALAIADKALALNPDEPWAHAAIGYAMIWRRPQDAIAPLQRALALKPNFAMAHYFLALGSTYAGCRGDVFAHADMAERMARQDLLARGYDGAHNNVRATASFAEGRYRDGVAFARKTVLDSPNSPTAYRTLAMNLALAGEVEEAKATLRMLKRVAPDMSQEWIEKNAVWAQDDEMRKYVEAFRLAGLK
jgi:TolB-like protein